MKIRGLAAIDRRTAGARALLDWRSSLLSDLGGAENLSTAKTALVEDVVRRKLFLDHIDAHLLELRTLLTRKGDLKPLVLKRERLADGLRGVLVTLGLERVTRRVPDLKTYLEERYGRSEEHEHGGPATQRAPTSAEDLERIQPSVNDVCMNGGRATAPDGDTAPPQQEDP